MIGALGVLHTDKNGNTRMIDLATRLLVDRVIVLEGEINEEMSTSICMQLRYLESEDKDKPITMLIQSPGGSVSAGLAIISTMNLIKCPVATVVQGCVASMASVIAAAGEKGMRYALPNTEIMLHTVASGTKGKIQDMEIDYEQTKKTNEKLMRMLAKYLNQSYDKVKKDCDRDFWMDENEWKKYGGCDEIKSKNK